MEIDRETLKTLLRCAPHFESVESPEVWGRTLQVVTPFGSENAEMGPLSGTKAVRDEV